MAPIVKDLGALPDRDIRAIAVSYLRRQADQRQTGMGRCSGRCQSDHSVVAGLRRSCPKRRPGPLLAKKTWVAVTYEPGLYQAEPPERVEILQFLRIGPLKSG